MLAMRMTRYTPTTTVMNNDAARSTTYLSSRMKVIIFSGQLPKFSRIEERIEDRDFLSSIFNPPSSICPSAPVFPCNPNFVSSLTVTNRKVLKEGKATNRAVTANRHMLEPYKIRHLDY